MRPETHFLVQLDNLWKRRTAVLRSLVVSRGAGQPPKFSRAVRDHLIEELLDDATELLIKSTGHKEFKKVVSERRLRQIRGHGLLNRGRNLMRWVEAELDGPIVYAFWRSNRCLYIGKGKTPGRLWHYERSAYLIQATCLKVFLVPRVSELGKAECLATHLFQPRDQKIIPAKAKWGKECPVCQQHDAIREELSMLFKMK